MLPIKCLLFKIIGRKREKFCIKVWCDLTDMLNGPLFGHIIIRHYPQVINRLKIIPHIMDKIQKLLIRYTVVLATTLSLAHGGKHIVTTRNKMFNFHRENISCYYPIESTILLLHFRHYET